MTKASSPCQDVAIPGYGECDSSDLETTESQNRGSHSLATNAGQPPISEHFTTTMSTPRPPRSKAERIQEGLERTISQDAKERIETILKVANELSDVEKLLLYLKLPTGSASDYVKDSNLVQSSNRLEQIQAVSWIKSHLEEHAETSLPKQEVFDDYKMYCDSHGFKFLSQADFGKVMKCAFPNVKPRRLGQRGQSKHCYGGLRKKLQVTPPMLPTLSMKTTPAEDDEDEDEVLTASCRVVCEWAQKLLNQPFMGVRELAQYLVSSLYVNSRSVSAFTILAALQRSEAQTTTATTTGSTTPVVTSGVSGGSRHRETQIQLARKLQQKELLRKHKHKLDGDSTSDDPQHLSQVEPAAHLPPVSAPEKQMKVTTNLTPQKRILPKSVSSPSTEGGVSAPHKAATVVSAPLATAGTQQQSILVISPTPHIKPQSLPSVVILSPVNQQRAARATLTPISRTQSLSGNCATDVRSVRPSTTMIRQQSAPAAAALQNAILAQSAGGSVQTLAQALAQATSQPGTVTLPVAALPAQSAPMAATQVLQMAATPLQAVRQATLTSPAPALQAIRQPSQTTPAQPFQQQALAQPSLSQQVAQLRPLQQTLITHRLPVVASTNTQLSTQTALTWAAVNSHVRPTSSTTSAPSHTVRTLLTGGQLPQAHQEVMTSQSGSSAFVPFEAAVVSPNSQPPMPQSLQAALDQEDIKVEQMEAALNSNSNSNDEMGPGSMSIGSDSNDTQSSPATPTSTPLLLSPSASTSLTPECERKLRLDRCGQQRPRLSSKTVSSLLKEQRGYGPVGDQNAPYVNDRRPVSTLLRECRQRRGSGGQIIMSPTVPLTPESRTPIMSPQTVLQCSVDGPPSIQPKPSGVNKTLLRSDGAPLLQSYLSGDGANQALLSAASQAPASQLPGLPQHSTYNLLQQAEASGADLKSLLQNSKHQDTMRLQKGMYLDGDVNVSSMEKDAIQEFVGNNNNAFLDLRDIAPTLADLQNIERDINSAANTTIVTQQQGTHILLDQVRAKLNSNMGLNTPNFSSPPTIKRLLSTNNTQQTLQLAQLSSGQTLNMGLNQVQIAAFPGQNGTSPLVGSSMAGPVQLTVSDGQQTYIAAPNSAGVLDGQLTQAQKLMLLAHQNAASGGNTVSQQLLQQLQLANLTSSQLSRSTSTPPVQPAQPPMSRSMSVDPSGLAFSQDLRQTALFRPVVVSDASMPPSPAVPPGSGMVSPALTGSMPPSPLVVAAGGGMMSPAMPGSNNSSMPASPMMSPQQSTTYLQGSSGGQNQLSNVAMSSLTIRERLAQKLRVPVDGKRDSQHFAPASSIRPVKRGCRGGKTGNSKRQRHHSAHSALGGPTKPPPTTMLAPTLHQQMSSLQQADQQRQLASSDNNLNLAAPESPFSPEMVDIFGSATQASQSASTTGMFRSQSVPVSDMFCSDSDNQELFAMASNLLDEKLNQEELMGTSANSELASLLQDKLYPTSQPSHRGLQASTSDEYGAKRNLNDILELQGTQASGMETDFQDNISALQFTRKGDMTLTSASLYGQTGLINRISQQQSGLSGPTPPESQTTTPDFSQDMSSSMLQSHPTTTPAANSGLILANTMDTPTSLDALSGQDSRESMVDPLFNGFYDPPADMAPSAAPMDMITNNDFTFGHWEMPQIATDGV